jgi:hypothetical protein
MTKSELEEIGLTPQTLALAKELVELMSEMKKQKASDVLINKYGLASSSMTKVFRLKSKALESRLAFESRLKLELFIIDYE